MVIERALDAMMLHMPRSMVVLCLLHNSYEEDDDGGDRRPRSGSNSGRKSRPGSLRGVLLSVMRQCAVDKALHEASLALCAQDNVDAMR